MPDKDSALSHKQLQVLKWVVEGCLPGVFEGYAHRISARSLEARGLLVIIGRGKSWLATATPAAMSRLAELDAGAPFSDVDLLIERVISAGGHLPHVGKLSREQQIALEKRALRSPRRPVGKQLRLRSIGNSWSGEPREWCFSDYVPDQVPIREVPIVQRTRNAHPVVDAFEANGEWNFVSSGSTERASRILQSLALACEKLGYRVDAQEDSWGTKMLVQLPAAAGRLEVDLREIPAGGGGKQTTLEAQGLPAWRARRMWKFVPSGRLEASLGGSHDNRQAHFEDGKQNKIEDRLPEIVREIEVTAIEAVLAAQKAIDRSLMRQQEWEAAMNSARAQLRDARRLALLDKQVEAHSHARRYREFATALAQGVSARGGPNLDAEREWIQWINTRADRIDPLIHPISIPEDREEFEPGELAPYLRGLSPSDPQFRPRR